MLKRFFYGRDTAWVDAPDADAIADRYRRGAMSLDDAGRLLSYPTMEAAFKAQFFRASVLAHVLAVSAIVNAILIVAMILLGSR